MTPVVLSKVATRITNSDEYNAEKRIQVFCYMQNTWEFFPIFSEKDCSTLLEILKFCEIGKLKAVNFIERNGELLVLYKNHVYLNKSHVELIVDLFYVLFGAESKGNQHIEEEIENKDNARILKTYVTTELFKALQRQHRLVSDDVLQMKLSLPDKFLPTLCNYQLRSVQWLLAKERRPSTFPQYYEKLKAKDNETSIYRHVYTHHVQGTEPDELVIPPGGILADEMGLGKTVEMLALILLNPRTDVNIHPRLSIILESFLTKRACLGLEVFCICTSKSQRKIIQCSKCSLWQHSKCVANYNDDHDVEINEPYICPSCWKIVTEECGILQSKGTFIVSPNAIKMQWLSEIKRHIQPSLRVLLYDGIVTGKWISPRQLSNYDVVLTDYNILRREIYYTNENISERSTRNKPRSIRMHTPILMLQWWRVCLDEAQMVESNTSNVAALVRMIPAINRWAVTGTPIQRSLNDLQPLLQFVGFNAVAGDKRTWNYLVNNFLLHHNTCPEEKTLELITVLQKCMWRTCKSQISNELQIPPQSQIVHKIQFDNLEKLFYNEQHAECKANFIGNIRKYTTRLSVISPQIMKLILQPFLKIRQSCTMPVVVINGPAVSQQKQFLQPEELHTYLKSSNETSCKSELRAMASSHNGLAALYFLQGMYDNASKHYEAVLKLAKDYNHMNLTVDSLLQIHALHNLMQIRIIQAGIDSNLPSPCLEPYESNSNTLEWKYLSTYSNTLYTVITAYQASVNKINSEIGANFIDSIAEALYNLATSDNALLVQKIHEECIPRFGIGHTKLSEIQSIRSLLYIVDLWYKKLDKAFNILKKEIDSLKYFTENIKPRHQVKPDVWRKMMELVHMVYDCHLNEIRESDKGKKDKSAEKTKSKCKMCCIRDLINNFECLLFDKVIDENTNFTEGLENPSFEMYLCKSIVCFLKNKNIEQNWVYLEHLQVFCKRIIKLWVEIEFTLKAYDELNMCKMRISLTEDTNDKSVFKIFKHEIEPRLQDQQSDLNTAQRQFTIKLARLKYIKHLESDEDMGPCPICHLLEEERYAVLECGHHICFQCLKSLQQYFKGTSFKCSVCRNTQQHQNLYYVSKSKSKKHKNELVKGNYSTKITYIIGLILKLLNADNDSNTNSNGHRKDIKMLIFSQWTPILQAISSALKENNITFRSQCTPKAFEEFKNEKLGVTCLLMPFTKGSKGLNLVEATHVFLVEPNLILGEELQAIGRVHRFGQTKPTTVHRFIMSDSIEENIYNFISSATARVTSANGVEKSEFENVSLDELQKLFELKTSKDYD